MTLDVLCINTLKVARKSALVKVADSGIAALRIVSGLAWIIVPTDYGGHNSWGINERWGDDVSQTVRVTILHRLRAIDFIQYFNRGDKS